MTYIATLIFSLFVFHHFVFGFVSSYNLQPDQAVSVKWLADQYQFQLNNISNCDGIPFDPYLEYFTINCLNYTNGTSYVNQIAFRGIQGLATPIQPNPNLVALYFPNITLMWARAAFATNKSINLLDKLRNLPNLYNLITNETTITSVPSSFPTNLPSLTGLTIDSVLNQGYPTNMMKLANLNTLTITINGTINNVGMGSHSALTSLTITVVGSGNNIFDGTFFPKLSNLYFSCPFSCYLAMTTEPPNNFNSLMVEGGKDSTQALTFTAYNFTKVTSLTLRNNIVLSNLTSYFPSLKVVSLEYPTISGIPYQWPSSLQQFAMYYSTTTQSFPTYPFPSSLNTLSLQSPLLTGPIPDPLFLGRPGYIDLKNNPMLTGPIPQSFCNVMLVDISGCAFTQANLPECFKCYFNDSNVQMSVALVNPSCNVTILNKVYISTDGKYITVDGNNLGYGNTPASTAVIPNRRIILDMTGYPPHAVNIPLSSYSKNAFIPSLTWMNVNISVASIEYQQLPNGTSFLITFSYINSSLQHTYQIGDIIFNVARSTGNQVSIYNSSFIIQQNVNYTLDIKNIYNNLSVPGQYAYQYPSVYAITSVDTGGGVITMFGSFGPIGSNVQYVKVNTNKDCIVQSSNQTHLICQLDSGQSSGMALVEIKIDSYTYSGSNLLSITPSIGLHCTLSSCIHGHCDTQLDECICDGGYYGDQCEYEPADGGVFIPNTTEPTAIFQINGFTFRFAMIAIQELNLVEDVTDHVRTTDQWIATVHSNTSTFLSMDYTLQLSPTVKQRHPQLNVTTRVEFSQPQRTIQFGDLTKTLPPNSIKIGVELNGWNFQSNLAHLRILFASYYNPDQYDECGKAIPPFSTNTQTNSIRYLNVVSGNVTYLGKFIDYVIADGCHAYSQTELVELFDNKTAIIGIHLPHAHFISMDPQFAPLVSTKTSNGCESTSSESFAKWKIAVIATCGAIVVIGAIVANFKRRRLYLKYLDFMSRKNGKKPIEME